MYYSKRTTAIKCHFLWGDFLQKKGQLTEYMNLLVGELVESDSMLPDSCLFRCGQPVVGAVVSSGIFISQHMSDASALRSIYAAKWRRHIRWREHCVKSA